ncbi:Protein trunk [Trichinella zimbabwensis]|uniref:Protein trunk n=1 Tax=Trichinella zimbabwensis TaxID=268475 RepID=A0A0V1HRM6_9BILA|nr:Protein trunk [Trichinella zimbabwensis]
MLVHGGWLTLVQLYSQLFPSLFLIITKIASAEQAVLCPPTPRGRLLLMLGAGYNSRYMSVDKPTDFFMPEFGRLDYDWPATNSDKPFPISHSSVGELNFKVEAGHQQVLLENVHNQHILKLLSNQRNKSTIVHSNPKMIKLKRQIAERSWTEDAAHLEQLTRVDLPWTCEEQANWIDLGESRFPRFVRSVTCSSDRCFYGHYRCRPRAFTVKILRRLTTNCINDDNGQLVEPWVFEEFALNLCCQCTV